MASTDPLRRDFKDREDLARYLVEEFSGFESGGPSNEFPLSSIRGGEQAARQSLLGFRAARYAAIRNYLAGNVSRLSPYLRHGVLTLKEVFSHVGPESYKFIQELAWRDYWQRLYFEWGNGIWLDRESWKTGLSASDYAGEMPADVLEARTHLACMDAFSVALIREGYLHNHARMWFAAYLVHWRRVQWQAAARWFLTHLLDGDPASNNLSWQWVASTFSHKPYFFNRENLERYTAGVYCAACPRKADCPFDKSYEVLSSELFPKAKA